METGTDKQIWKDDYVDPMFKKYKSVPTKLKYMFIEKDFTRMFGKNLAAHHINMMTDECEDFIFAFENALCEFGKVARKNLIKKYWEGLALDDYIKLADSGSYFKYFSGNWKQDKEYFINFIAEREKDKEYVKLILE